MDKRIYKNFQDFVQSCNLPFLPVTVKMQDGEVTLEIVVRGKKTKFWVDGSYIRQAHVPALIPNT